MCEVAFILNEQCFFFGKDQPRSIALTWLYLWATAAPRRADRVGWDRSRSAVSRVALIGRRRSGHVPITLNLSCVRQTWPVSEFWKRWWWEEVSHTVTFEGCIIFLLCRRSSPSGATSERDTRYFSISFVEQAVAKPDAAYILEAALLRSKRCQA